MTKDTNSLNRVLDASPRTAVQCGHFVLVQFIGIEQIYGPAGGLKGFPLTIHTVALIDAYRVLLIEFGDPKVIALVHALSGDVFVSFFGDTVQYLLSIAAGIKDEQRIIT